jgi:hypothetical protein
MRDLMHGWEALPDDRLSSDGELTAQFSALGIADYRAAGRFVSQLPYGRNAERANFRLVLSERRGTCSTKHAIVAALAIENRLPVELTLGIYEMNERNTPGVGAVLAEYGLVSLPEAHCYLTCRGIRIDVTRSSINPTEPISRFLHEEAISPEMIGDYKVRMHQNYIREWATRAVTGRSWEQVWNIREQCISALSGGS